MRELFAQNVDSKDIKECYDEIFKGSLAIKTYDSTDLISMSIKDSSTILRVNIGKQLDFKKCQLVPRSKLITYMEQNLANMRMGACIRSGFDYYKTAAEYASYSGILDNKAVLNTIYLLNHLEQVGRLCADFS